MLNHVTLSLFCFKHDVKNKVNNINNAVYIDMYVADPEVVCIDQHVICANQEHHHKITKNSNKFNPKIY